MCYYHLMTCKNCNKEFSPDELDTDGFCFDCANLDLDYNPDTTDIVKELLEDTMNSLANARNVSPDKIKTDLVAEHFNKNPDKHIKEIISQAQATTKKKSSGNN